MRLKRDTKTIGCFFISQVVSFNTLMYCLFKFSRIYVFFFVEKIIYIFFRYDISGNKFGVYQEELYDGFTKLGLRSREVHFCHCH